MTHSDRDLIQAYVRNQCRRSLDALVARHLPRVRSLVDSMLLDTAAVDDVTQEVFLRAVRALESFREQSRFSTWLYRIAMNTVYSHLEARRRLPHPSAAAEDLDAHSAQADAPPTPPEQALLHELEDRMESALSRLSPKFRAAIVLVCQEGLTAAEAAEIEGCTASTISWRVHEARKRLERQLAQYLEGG